MECQYDNAMTYLNGYHGGLGFKNVRTGYNITVNFDALPTFMGAVVPELVYHPNGEVELSWSDDGGVLIYLGINMTFWAYGSEDLVNITGAQFNILLDWFVDYNSTNQPYDIWSVFTQYPLQPWDQTWIPAHDCFAFVWQAMDQITQQGVILPKKTASHSIVALLSPTAPIKLDMNNPIERAYVVSFYQYLLNQLEKYGVTAILTLFRELLYEERMIIRSYGEYYMIQPWSPWIDTYFVQEPFPPYED